VLGKEPLGFLLESRDTDDVLAALLRRRAEVEAWLDGPVKKATVTSIDRMIAELQDDAPSGAAERASEKHPRRAAG
jgi:hypothetical protein